MALTERGKHNLARHIVKTAFEATRPGMDRNEMATGFEMDAATYAVAGRGSMQFMATEIAKRIRAWSTMDDAAEVRDSAKSIRDLANEIVVQLLDNPEATPFECQLARRKALEAQDILDEAKNVWRKAWKLAGSPLEA